jgi:hypothetical protein
MTDVQTLASATDAFGPVAGFVIVALIFVIVFLWKDREKRESRSHADLVAMRTEYLKLMKTMLGHISDTGRILDTLDERITANQDMQKLVLDFLSKRLEDG